MGYEITSITTCWYVVYTVVALEALVNSTDFSEHSMVCPRSEPEGQALRV